MQKTPIFTTFSAHTKMAADKRGQIEVFGRNYTIALSVLQTITSVLLMVRLPVLRGMGQWRLLQVVRSLRIVKFISVPWFFWNVKSWWGELEANRCCDCCDASHFVVLVDPNTASGTRQIWPVHVECWCGTLCICTLIPETVRLPLVSIFAPTPCPGSLRYLWGFWGISPLDSCWTINWWDIGGLQFSEFDVSCQALRALVMSVVDTTRQLLWALILLGLVQYSFGSLAGYDMMCRCAQGMPGGVYRFWQTHCWDMLRLL